MRLAHSISAAFGRKALSHPPEPPYFRLIQPRRFGLDLLAELLTCAQDFLLVHGHKSVVVDNNLTVANDGAGASSGGVEYEVAPAGHSYLATVCEWIMGPRCRIWA